MKVFSDKYRAILLPVPPLAMRNTKVKRAAIQQQEADKTENWYWPSKKVKRRTQNKNYME